MRRETQNILLILLGGALLKIGINGDYLKYVKPGQQPWVIVGGIVIAGLGLFAVLGDVLAARHKSQKKHDDPESLHHHPARSAWLLLVPVLAVFLIAPPALGADSVTRTQARGPQSSAAEFSPLPPGPVVPMSLSDFVTRAGWDKQGTLNGRTVSLTGFIVQSKGDIKLARMVISCCAADAFPLTLRLKGPGSADFASDTWVEVVGKLVPGTAVKENGYTADMTVESIRSIVKPQDPYEY